MKSVIPRRRKTRRNFQGTLPEEFAAGVPMDDAQRRVVFMSAALLLDYPDDRMPDILAAVGDSLGDLPMETGERLSRFLQYATDRAVDGPSALQQDYVATFDQRRRCSLSLSYYAVGDTRQRGAAILAFSRQLEDLGFTLIREELPDHLCVLLESAAQSTGDSWLSVTEMLASHRDGLEVLRTALSDLNSPYAELVTCVCSALPSVSDATADNYRRLVRSGPPSELVGLGTPLPATGMEHQP